VRLNHRIVGSGPPLVLVHGLGSCLCIWDPVIDRLAEEREVLALDLPGFGDSPALSRRPTATALAQEVIGLLDDVGWKSPAVCGNSLGGLVALEVAYLGRADSVVAISPAGAAAGWERYWSQGLLRIARGSARATDAVLDRLSRSAAGRTAMLGVAMARPQEAKPGWAAHVARTYGQAEGFGRTLRAVDLPDAHRRYRRLDVPVRIVWGSRDRILLPRQAARYGEVLPNAEIVELEGLGHTPMADDPDLVARVVLEGSQTPASSA
jgi:pimeloyl-ACP methyl ester carboxylesterase